MLQDMVAADRTATYPDTPVNYFPVVAPEGEPAVLATPDSYEFFLKTREERRVNWINQVTVESIEKMIENDPADAMELISPTALMIVAAVNDSLIPIELVRETFERAGEPKKLVEIQCGHFDVYDDEPWHGQAAGAAVDWFVTHLGSKGT